MITADDAEIGHRRPRHPVPHVRPVDGSNAVNPDPAYSVLAAEFDVPVCPHAGGVGLCELVQHLSDFHSVRVSGQLDGRMIENVDHRHEHFLDPVAETLSRCALAARQRGRLGRSGGLIHARPRESWAVAADRLDPQNQDALRGERDGKSVQRERFPEHARAKE